MFRALKVIPAVENLHIQIQPMSLVSNYSDSSFLQCVIFVALEVKNASRSFVVISTANLKKINDAVLRTTR